MRLAPPTPKAMKISAPQIDIGTLIRMVSGSRKLSNRAASVRKIMISAKKKVTISALDS